MVFIFYNLRLLLLLLLLLLLTTTITDDTVAKWLVGPCLIACSENFFKSYDR